MWFLISGDFQEETPSAVLGLLLDLEAGSWKKKENIFWGANWMSIWGPNYQANVLQVKEDE